MTGSRPGFSLCCSLLAGLTLLPAVEPPRVDAPAEQVEVHLALIDVLVLDRGGRTVPDLGRDDFELIVDGRAATIDTLDAACPDGALEDPRGIPAGGKRSTEPRPLPRRLVILFDNYHMEQMERVESLRQTVRIVRETKGHDEEILLATLGNGLRIEHPFTADAEALMAVLDRLRADPGFWARDFGSLTDRFFFEDLATLMDVLGEYEGAKAVVIFSTMGTRADETDLWFGDVAQRAAAGRVSLYPVWAAGLIHRERAGGSGALARLANESGGRLTRNTNDLSLAYTRARRDLACRYTIGFYLDATVADEARQVRVRVAKPGFEVRAPEQFRVWGPDERRAARVRAALADPGLHEDPRIEIDLHPLRPTPAGNWHSLLAVRLPAETPPPGAEGELTIRLEREGLRLAELERVVPESARETRGPGSGAATLLSGETLRPGNHVVTAVLVSSEGAPPRSRRVEVRVPEVPVDRWFVRGPMLALPPATAGARRLRDSPKDDVAAWREVTSENGLAAPLGDAAIRSGEPLLAVWHACAGGGAATGAVRVERRLLDADGATVTQFEPIDLEQVGGDPPHCHGSADEIGTSGLSPGPYSFRILVFSPVSGPALASGEASFHVR